MATRSFDIPNPDSGKVYYDNFYIDPNNGSYFEVRVWAKNRSGDNVSVAHLDAGYDPQPGSLSWQFGRGVASLYHWTNASANTYYRSAVRWTSGSGYSKPDHLHVEITYSGQVVNKPPTAPYDLAPTGEVSDTLPTLSATFADPDEPAGDQLSAYQIYVWDAGGNQVWNSGKLNASKAEGNAGRMSRAYTGPELTRGSSYTWAVRMYDSFGAVSPVSWHAPITIQQAPNAPTLASIRPNSRVSTLTPAVSFQYTHPNAVGMGGYMVRVYDEDTNQVVYWSGDTDGTAANNDTVTWTTPRNGSLFWGEHCKISVRVRDTNGTWSGWSSDVFGWVSFHVNAQPTVAIKSPTSAQTISSTTIPVTWDYGDPDNDVQGGYRVVATNVATNGVTYDSGWINSPTAKHIIPAGALVYGTKYSIVVTVRDNFGPLESAPSAPVQFTPIDAPSVAVTSPAEGSAINRAQYTFSHSFSPSSNGGTQTSYEYTFTNVDAPDTNSFDSGLLQGAGTEYTPPLGVLQNGASYQVTVTVTDSNGATGISSPLDFKVFYQAPFDLSAQELPDDENYIASTDISAPAPYMSSDDDGDGIANDFEAVYDLENNRSIYFDGSDLSKFTVPNSSDIGTTLLNKSASFDGATSVLRFNHDPKLNPSTGSKTLTLQAKLKANALPPSGTFPRVLAKYNAYELFLNPDGSLTLRLTMDAGGGSTANVDVTETSTLIAPNTWYSVEADYNGSYIRIFVNGVQAAVQAETRPLYADSGSHLYIGSRSSGDFWNGMLDEVQISKAIRHATSSTTVGTSVFSPSGSNFSPDADTMLLLHLDSSPNDSSPNAFAAAEVTNITWSNDVGWMTGTVSVEQSATFNGTNSGIIYPTSAALNAPTGSHTMTVQAKFKIPSLPSSNLPRAIAKDQAYEMYINSVGVLSMRFWFDNGAGGSTALATSTNSGVIAPNQWYHVEVSYDGANIRIFVNGVLQAVQAQTLALYSGSTANLRIGNDNTAFWRGQLDEIHISNVVRHPTSSTTIGAQIFTPSTINYVPDANTMILLHLNGNAGDAGPNAVAASSVTSVTWSNDVGWMGLVAVTLRAWFKIDTLTGQFSRLICKENSYYLGLDPTGKVEYKLWSSDGRIVNAVGATAIPVGQWHLAEVGYNGTVARLFIDGVEDTTAATTTSLSLALSPNNLCLGYSDGVSGRGFRGWIGQAEVAKVARSSANYTPTHDYWTADPNTVAMYKFLTLPVTLDSGPNGLTGVITNVSLSNDIGWYKEQFQVSYALALAPGDSGTRQQIQIVTATGITTERRAYVQQRLDLVDAGWNPGESVAVKMGFQISGSAGAWLRLQYLDSTGAVLPGTDQTSPYQGSTAGRWITLALTSRTVPLNAATVLVQAGISALASGQTGTVYLRDAWLAHDDRADWTTSAAAVFDGTSGQIAVASSPVLNFGGAGFTARCNFVPTALPATSAYLMYRNNDFFLRLDSTGALVGRLFGQTVSYDASTPAGTIAAGNAYWASLTYDGAVLRLFVNGVLAGSVNATDTLRATSTDPLYLGSGGSASYYRGTLDEVEIASTARFTASYSPLTSSLGQDDSTVVLYHLDGNATDSGPNALPGTVTGGVTWTPSGYSANDALAEVLAGDMGNGYLFDAMGYSVRKQLIGFSVYTTSDPTTSRITISWDAAFEDNVTGDEWRRWVVYYRSDVSSTPGVWQPLDTITDPSVTDYTFVYAGSGTQYDFGVTQVVAFSDGTEVESQNKAIASGSVSFDNWWLMNRDRPNFTEVLENVEVGRSWQVDVAQNDIAPANQDFIYREYGRVRGVKGLEITANYGEWKGDDILAKAQFFNHLLGVGGIWALKDPRGVVFFGFLNSVSIDQTQTGEGNEFNVTLAFDQAMTSENI